MRNGIELYLRLHSKRKNTRIGLFRIIKEKYNVEKVLYPGAFIHITPSLVFSKVVYVDSIKRTGEFFENPELMEYLKENKEYMEEPKLRFHSQSYRNGIPELENSFDLLISHYAGLVSQFCKPYLKKGGILLVNDSHGDATMANLDEDYDFIAAYDKVTDENYKISPYKKNEYFIPMSRKIEITQEYVTKLGRGVSYLNEPSGYIFKKVV